MARCDSFVTVRNVALVISDSPGSSFRSCKFGMIARTEVVPTIRNLPLVAGDSYCARFRLRQLGPVAGGPAVLASRQVLRKIGSLGNHQNRPQGDAGYFRAKVSPRTGFHVRPPFGNQVKLTETGGRSRSAGITSRMQMPPTYFLSSWSSAMCACWPASDTAFKNASALRGVVALPERMLRKVMRLP